MKFNPIIYQMNNTREFWASFLVFLFNDTVIIKKSNTNILFFTIVFQKCATLDFQYII